VFLQTTVLYYFWRRDGHLDKHNRTELAVYQLADGVLDCRDSPVAYRDFVAADLKKRFANIWRMKQCYAFRGDGHEQTIDR